MKYLLSLAVLALPSLAWEGVFDYWASGANWNNTDCIFGQRQSPIDLPLSETRLKMPTPALTPSQRLLGWEPTAESRFRSLSLLSFDADYEEFVNVTVENVTNTIRMDINHIDGYFIVYEDDRSTEVFKPLQFHFHSPSEHTFNGLHYDLELHVYHISIDKLHKSVVAVFFDMQAGGNKSNPFIQSLFTSNDNSSIDGNESWTPVDVSLQDLYKKLDKKKMFHYEGSLTTPPCSQNVEWQIINDPQPISPEQLARFKNKWSNNKLFAGGRGNNRLTQPLFDRKIYFMGGSLLSVGLGIFLVALSAVM